MNGPGIFCSCERCSRNFGRRKINKANKVIGGDTVFFNYLYDMVRQNGKLLTLGDLLDKVFSMSEEELEYHKLMAHLSGDR